MSKMIESMIECPFNVKEVAGFISCEGVLDNSTITHKLETYIQKRNYEYTVCCVNGGRRCSHFKNVSLLYERGVRA